MYVECLREISNLYVKWIMLTTNVIQVYVYIRYIDLYVQRTLFIFS